MSVASRIFDKMKDFFGGKKTPEKYQGKKKQRKESIRQNIIDRRANIQIHQKIESEAYYRRTGIVPKFFKFDGAEDHPTKSHFSQKGGRKIFSINGKKIISYHQVHAEKKYKRLYEAVA